MKILFNIHSLCIGGAETVVTNYMQVLKQMGHEVVLVADEREESFLQEKIDACGIRTISLRPQNSYSFWGKLKRIAISKTMNYEKRWRKILDEEKPDIIHLHSKAWELPFPSSRVAYTFHAEVERNLSILGKDHQAALQRLVDNGMRIFCMSDRASSTVRRIFKTEHVERIPNGVDLDRIRAQRYDRTDFLRQQGIPLDAFVMGHVGRIHPVKNHKKVLEVFAEVAKRRSDAYLILVGTGQPDYVKTVKEWVHQMELDDRVLFMGLRSDATQIMSTFDALLLPSLSESFSLTLVEAQALGIRCVASNVVPEEVVCNDDCFALSLEEPAEKWAEYILGDYTQKKNNSLKWFDMLMVMEALVRGYQKMMD